MSESDPTETSSLINVRSRLGAISHSRPLRKVLGFRHGRDVLLRGHMQRREFITLFGGPAATWPLAVRAQQPAGRVYRVGYLALLPGEDTTLAKPLLQRLQELGYRKGMNMILEYRSADGRAERLPQLAAELVR